MPVRGRHDRKHWRRRAGRLRRWHRQTPSTCTVSPVCRSIDTIRPDSFFAEISGRLSSRVTPASSQLFPVERLGLGRTEAFQVAHALVEFEGHAADRLLVAEVGRGQAAGSHAADEAVERNEDDRLAESRGLDGGGDSRRGAAVNGDVAIQSPGFELLDHGLVADRVGMHYRAGHDHTQGGNQPGEWFGFRTGCRGEGEFHCSGSSVWDSHPIQWMDRTSCIITQAGDTIFSSRRVFGETFIGMNTEIRPSKG